MAPEPARPSAPGRAILFVVIPRGYGVIGHRRTAGETLGLEPRIGKACEESS